MRDWFREVTLDRDALIAGRECRWGETFAALVGRHSDTLDTIRHFWVIRSPVALSQSVNSGQQRPPRLRWPGSILPAVDRALAIWGEAEAERAVIVGASTARTEAS